MNRRTIEEHMADHYRDTRLPPSTATRLARLARADAQNERKGAAGLGTVRYAVAACIGLLGVSIALQVVGLARDRTMYVARPINAVGDGLVGGTQTRDVSHLLNRGQVAPRLVAMHFSLDGCPYTEETTPVFTSLMNKYGDRPVIFTQYDITDERVRMRSANLARAIGVGGLYEGLFQSGVIELIDRETGEILSVMHRRDELSIFEDALVQALQCAGASTKSAGEAHGP